MICVLPVGVINFEPDCLRLLIKGLNNSIIII